jgi:proteasome lid subunit RPN8/RPN11
VLIIPQPRLDEMLAHVSSNRTQEMCGLMAGDGHRVTRVLPVPNSLGSPWAYQMDGPEFVDAMKACEFEPLTIFHSHLSGPPTPSLTDVAQALYPDSFYIIVSFHVEPPSVRAFRIAGGRVDEVEIRIE